MSQNYHEILQSEPFRFIEGAQQKELFLPPALVAKHSAPLNNLINGPMQEAQKRCAELKDVDPDTFVRFAEYLYTGSYPAAIHSVLLSAECCGTETQKDDRCKSDGCDDSDLSDASSHSYYERKKTSWANPVYRSSHNYTGRRQSALAKFQCLKYRGPANPSKQPTPRPNKEPNEEYSDVFLSHARLYVFADQYDINDLRSLSLKRLHETLKAFHFYPDRAGDVAALLRYTYENTPDRPEAMDMLRLLVIRYVSCFIELMKDSEDFKSLLRGENAFASDLFFEGILGRLE